MVRYSLRFRQADKDIFENIRSGKKTVETRAATVKYKNIKAGDTVIFVCDADKFEKQVKSAEIFKSISEMLQKHRIQDIAPKLTTEGDLIKMYHGFPGYEEKIKEFGLIALRFE